MSDAQPVSRALVSLAVLHVEWDAHRRSYFDNVVDFAVEAMRASGRPDYSQEQVAQAIQDVFAFSVRPAVVGNILTRVVAHGQGIRLRDGRVRLRSVAPSGSLVQARTSLAREQQKLVSTLSAFVAHEFNLEWDDEEASQELFEFVERNAPSLLRELVRGAEASRPKDAPRLAQVAVAKWIELISEREPDQYAYLENVIKGSMLATAVFSGNEGDFAEKFRGTLLLLDTPVLLDALGFHGETEEAVALDIFELSLDQGARLACFEDTLAETRGVLLAAADGFGRPPRSRRESIALVKRSLSREDIRDLAGNLEGSLAALGVVIVTRPPIDSRTSIDEKALEASLRKKITYDRNPTAVVHDVNAVVAVRNLRKGTSDRVERCGALFVTTNVTLVRVVREFPGLRGSGYQLASSLTRLAEILWVKNPVKAPNLPYNRLLADCYAVLSPAPEVWEAYDREIERLAARGTITEEQVALARHSRVAVEAVAVSAAKRGKFDPSDAKAALVAAEQHAAAKELEKVAALEERLRHFEDRDRWLRESIQRESRRRALLGRSLVFGIASIAVGAALLSVEMPQVVRVLCVIVTALVAVGGGVSGFGAMVGEWFGAVYRGRAERKLLGVAVQGSTSNSA